MRFPEFTYEWESKELGKIGKTYNGLSGKSGSDFGQGSPYITYKSIFNKAKIDLSHVEYVTISDSENQNRVNYGDIFFTTSSETPNEVGMSSVLLENIEDCYLNSFCFGYRLNSLVEYLPQFFCFYLRSDIVRKSISILAQGSTRFNISKNEVMKIKINLPLSQEQQKIASFLSILDQRIETQSQIIKKYESLIKGLIYNYVKGEETNARLKDCLICHSSTLMENAVAEKSGVYPVYGASGIIAHTPDFEINKDAILIIKDGSGVGKVQYAMGKYSVIGTLNYLTPQEGVSLKYFYYYLQAFNFDKYKVGSGIPHIYFKDYGNEHIYCPPIDVQNKIAKFLSTIDEKLSTERQLLQKYIEQKRYFLSHMFI